MEKTLFSLEKTTIQYNGHAILSDISLRIEEGSKIALVGQSGAGKSTLLTQLYEASNRDVALVPQELGLVRNLSVFHNIYMGRLNRHGAFYNILNLIKPTQKELINVRPVAEKLGLADKLFAPVQELSGGQQQRTAVGRAIFKGSPVFFGDEPVSAVDEHQSHTVLSTIMKSHKTVILSMHDVKLALHYSDRVIGLKNGVKVLDESTRGMKTSDLDDLYQE
ncbi:ATP-binding cassette domain-containing protein [Rhodospirillales bacterium]|nr:ATP-binding cassette domain-containing protein [Rhodospirillales bacterium]